MPPRHTDGPPPERSFWDLLPKRNFRRVVFLILVLVAVVALKRSSGRSLNGLLDAIAPPPKAAAPAPATFQRLQVAPLPGAGGAHP